MSMDSENKLGLTSESLVQAKEASCHTLIVNMAEMEASPCRLGWVARLSQTQQQAEFINKSEYT